MPRAITAVKPVHVADTCCKVCASGNVLVIVPVYDAALVKEQYSADYLGSVEPRSTELELSGALDLEHEVPSVYILHNEEQSVLK